MVAAKVFAVAAGFTGGNWALVIFLAIVGIALAVFLALKTPLGSKLGRKGVAVLAVVLALGGAIGGIAAGEKSVANAKATLDRVTSVFTDAFPDGEVSNVVLKGRDNNSSTANVAVGDCTFVVTLGGRNADNRTYKLTDFVADGVEVETPTRGGPLADAQALVADNCAPAA